jgi:anti-anti-sigma factor
MIVFISRAQIPIPKMVQTNGDRPRTSDPLANAFTGGHNPHVPATPFHVERTQDRTVRFVGELDLGSFEIAVAGLEPLLAGDGDIEVELADLTFMDSSGIRVLVKCRRELEGRGRLLLRGANPHVAKILEIAGLQDLGVRIEDGSDG